MSFLLFNCIFSPYARSINLNIETKIQKDVFSTVLFVSETIGKISVSISNIFTLKADVPRKSAEEQSGKAESAAVNDILFLSSFQNKKIDSNVSLYALKIFSKRFIPLKLTGEFRLRTHDDRSIISNFLERMLFYISSKSVYDNVVSYNNINRLFINPS